MSAMAWLLRESVSARAGKPLYFAEMTAIGPITTPDTSAAAHFASEVEAFRAQPRHALTFWEPVEVDLTVEKAP